MCLAVLQRPRVAVGARSMHLYKLLGKVITPTQPSSLPPLRKRDHSAQTPKDNSLLVTWGSELREVINNLQRTFERSLGTLAPAQVAELNLVPSEKDFFFCIWRTLKMI